jgi:hypothetical protein
MAWHIKAERCKWIGEFISESIRPESIRREKRTMRANA